MYCPQCGKPLPGGAAACPTCGAAVEAQLAQQAATPGKRGDKASSRTMIGIAAADVLPRGLSKAGAANKTLVGLPAAGLGPRGEGRAEAQPAAEARPAEPGGGGADRALAGTLVVGTPVQLAGQAPQQRGVDGTLLGQAAPRAPVVAAAPPAGAAAPQPAAPAPAPQVLAPPAGSGTLLGVARPGIAPLAPGADETVDDLEPTRDDGIDATVDDAPRELGATLAPQRAAPRRASRAAALDLRRHAQRPRPKAAATPAGPRRALWLVIAGGVLALFAVLFVMFWPDPPPVTARARADAGGRDVLELRCASCPDGTVVAVGEARATVASGAAQIPLAAPLSVGENRMKVAIDRPGRGRDETIGISANVAYRIAPDLGTLQGERPTIQVVVEAMSGTEVLLDGKALPLTGGRAVEALDVLEAITGPSEEARTLARQVPYAVTPPDGSREQGVVSVSVGIVPLWIDAPGPSVVIDKESFVLEGRTAKGARLFAGPHPIPVRADGTFAHVMNVSSVGATQFEVRAKMDGMAPRIVKIAVRRVDRLEAAAKDFMAQKPAGWAALLEDPKGLVGKPVAIAGEVLEARRQGHATVVLLGAPPGTACKGAGRCTARLVHGVQIDARRGDRLSAYGRGAPPFTSAGGAEVPEVQVEFAIEK